MKQHGRMLWFLRVLVIALIAAAFSAGRVSAAASADQVHMEEALTALNSAKTHLGMATADKGGHRAKAMHHVNEAIAEVNAGMGYARRH